VGWGGEEIEKTTLRGDLHFIPFPFCVRWIGMSGERWQRLRFCSLRAEHPSPSHGPVPCSSTDGRETGRDAFLGEGRAA